MDFEKYVNKLEFPKRPIRPRLVGTTAKSAKEYTLLLDQYEIDFTAWTNQNIKYHIHEKEVHEMFDKDAIDELELNDLPQWQKDRLLSYAWNESHSGGYSEVFNMLQELVMLLKE